MNKIKTVCLTLAMAGLAMHSAEAAKSGKVKVTGKIAQSLDITVTAFNNKNLDLTTDDTALVAMVDETSNSPTGYTVSISTDSSILDPFKAAGEAAFVGQDAGLNDSESLLYAISYNGSAPAFVDGIDPAITDTTALANADPKTLEVTWAGSGEFLPAGNYADTIYLVIAAK